MTTKEKSKIKVNEVKKEKDESKNLSKAEVDNGDDNLSETSQASEEIYKKLSIVFIKLEEKGLAFKNASYGRSRTEYVRGDELLKSLKENIEYLCKEVNTICGTEIDPKAEDAVQQIYNEFNEREMIAKAVRFKEDGKLKYPKRLDALEENLDDGGQCGDEGCNVKHESKAKKSQHNISRAEMQKFDEKIFYALDLFRDETKKTYFWLFLIIFGVLMYTLLPVWPLEVKIAIWWVSYILLVFMIGIISIRLTIFALFYIFGVDFWLLPNLFDDKLGFFDSFKPVQSFAKRTETLITILIRIGITAFVAYLAWIVYEDPNSINDFISHLGEINTDVYDYGKDKIVNWGVRFFLFKNFIFLFQNIFCLK
jgi:translocation protein SEC62